MLPEERRIFILKQLNQNGKVEVDKLAQHLNVSQMTIRRDLDMLTSRGLAFRTHGGAISPNINNEIPLDEKMVTNIDAKRKIGEYAASLINENESILLDAGTTCLSVAQSIKNRKNITVITNDIRIVFELYQNPNIKLICAGGLVQAGVGAMIGFYTEKMIESVTVDKAFVGTSTIDNNLFISTPTIEKASLKRKYLKNSNASILLADSSKFGRSSLFKVCNLKDFDMVISDNELDRYFTDEMEKKGINYYLT
ncbi:MAG: DeoR/GlpR family DNA-binding transcription regulator [Thermoanaerobacteraceae bacterium]|nr:DeoR/GlpR family DNA-binding transcription regulator [Thermoanaerobacteraceae bacterium]